MAQTEEGKATRHGDQNGVMQSQVKEDRQPWMLEESSEGSGALLTPRLLPTDVNFRLPASRTDRESVSDICGGLLLRQLSNN